MALTHERAIALKTALYKDCSKHGEVVPGFRAYKRVNGEIVGVPTVGVQCRAMIRAYEKRKGLPITGTFDQATQDSLIPAPPKPVVTPGQRVANEAHALLELAPVHYTQNRPYQGTATRWKLYGGDCSGTAILCYKLAGLPDPNGTGYDGSGYTGSLVVRGHEVAYADLAEGDLVFYGTSRTNTEHVTIYVGGGFVVSHGHEGGPFYLKVDYRDDRVAIRRYV